MSPTGPSGSIITLTGSGFGSDSQLISVTINHVPCNVTSVSDTQVQCTAGNNPGGEFPVMLHHQVKGHAQSDVKFKYELTLSSVQPHEGKNRREPFSPLYSQFLVFCVQSMLMAGLSCLFVCFMDIKPLCVPLPTTYWHRGSFVNRADVYAPMWSVVVLLHIMALSTQQIGQFGIKGN